MARHRLNAGLLMIGVALLPFVFQPLRLEAHETHRAGLLVILIVVSLLFVRPRFDSSSRPLGVVVVIWCVALTLSVLIALSPARAVFGDSLRRMGLLTHLTFISGILLASSVHWKILSRLFWLAGVLVALYVVLQFTGLLPVGVLVGRPSGPLGVPVFTAGWLALAFLFAAPSVMTETTGHRRLWLLATMVLMPVALVLTDSQGAAGALAAGAVTGGLAWCAVRGRRWLATGIVGSLAVIILVVATWGGSTSGVLSFLSRLSRDSSFSFRVEVWGNAHTLTRENPVLVAMDGQTDPYHSARWLTGYGLESFETLYRLKTDIRLSATTDHPVDRAHNVFYDTVLMTGLAGLAAQVALWLTAVWVALRRLGLPGWGALLAAAGGLVVAHLSGWPVYAPLLAVAGGLLSLWGYLALYAFRPRDKRSVDTVALTALAVLVAQVLDLQFEFTSVVVGWTGWLAYGLLLGSPPAESEQRLTPEQVWSWVGLVGCILLRSLLRDGGIGVVLLLIGLVAVVWPLYPPTGLRWVVVLWGLGAIAAFVTVPELVALIDVVWLVACLFLLTGMNVRNRPLFRVRSRDVVRIAILVLVGVWWARDIAAYQYAKRGDRGAIEQAVSLNGWDERLLVSAGNSTFAAALNDPQPAASFARAGRFYVTAESVDRYNSLVVWRLAVFSAVQGKLDEADGYYTAAARLWPTNSLLWREWAYFAFSRRGDPLSAYLRVTRSLWFDPLAPAARELQQLALSQLGFRLGR